MLNVPLITLRRELRAETGTSLNPAQGRQAEPTIDLQLARQQRELWDAYTWQHLKIYADVPLVAGQALYDYPVTILFDQVNDLMVSTGPGASWQGLAYGVEAHMIPRGAPATGTPLRWRNVTTINTSGPTPITNPVGQFELHPTPNTDDMVLRVAGQAPLSPLIDDNDKCIIDSTCIVLFAAAEVLANQKSESAPLKLQKAQNYLRRLLADQGADKRQNYNMGGRFRGGIDPVKSRRAIPYIDYIPS